MVAAESYGVTAGSGTLRGNSVATLQRGPYSMSSIVDKQYNSRMDALSPHERIARCAAMLKWTRDLLARQIIAELGEMSHERLKWEVAKRMYGADKAAGAIIDQRLNDVSS